MAATAFRAFGGAARAIHRFGSFRRKCRKRQVLERGGWHGWNLRPSANRVRRGIASFAIAPIRLVGVPLIAKGSQGQIIKQRIIVWWRNASVHQRSNLTFQS